MLSHALRASGHNSTIPPYVDPNFNQVSLLLHGDGTNGAQNNTFLDSSTNNFSITRNGNTTQGTNTPFSQAAGAWSNYFDGTNGGISTSSTSQFNLSTNNFTAECWFYLTSATSEQDLFTIVSTSSGGYAAIRMAYKTTGFQPLISSSGSTWLSTSTFTATIPINTWNHLAFVRNGSTFTLYFNGVSIGTITNSSSLCYDASTRSYVGSFNASTSLSTSGYISNFRLVNGTAVYTSAFTPSTTPLTAITNTALLTCQSNYFKDNSSNNAALTAGSTNSVQPFSPFALTSAYSTSVNGGSMYFDGTGDYLKNTSGTAFTFGTGDFTIEYWTYTSSFGSGFICHCGSATTAAGFACGFNTGSIYGTTSTTAYNTGVTPPFNQWIHIVWVRSGTTLKCYLNGSSIYTTTVSTNFTETGFTIGAYGSGTNAMPAGYLSDVRTVIGTAVYTANFTPPTAPLTAITNTSLLLSGTNAGIYDNAIKNNLETVGNAQVSTSVVKYGTGSVYCNGSGNYLTIPPTQQLAFGTGDFTIECWINAPATQAAYAGIYVSRNTATVVIQFDASGAGIVVYFAGQVAASTTNITGGAWHHVAFVRYGGVCKIYIDGTAGSFSLTDNANILYGTVPTLIGNDSFNSSRYFTGYLDDLRVTKGVARYTANFTPPTQAFPNQ